MTDSFGPSQKNGQFTVKSAYKLISGQFAHMHNPSSINPTYKSLWKLRVLPKVQLFIWKCHEKILPTKSNVYKFSVGRDITCRMCNASANETAEHIILHFPFAKAVWSLTPYRDLLIQDSNMSISISDWVSKWLATLISKKRLLALKMINETEQLLKCDVSQIGIPPTNPVGVDYNATTIDLPDDCVIVYCDASHDSNSNLSGIGLVMNDNAGNFLGCKIIFGIARNAEEAESLALPEAAIWTREKGKENACFISDAKVVIDCLKSNNNQLCWYNISILNDCKSVLESFMFSKFEFLNRSFTYLDDIAAKHGRKNRVNGEWFGYIPYFLTEHL
ncbi:uncharacterized protein LOC113324301 [Papaver somniferum]|uniref:uncharacterized protein LOC113324301 n=1 Tax=Papaver somniferum TaxID=3469 RepID=UPI000E703A97|nr:uncharacterized protein LOC113324301 [Papaver somniferum]